MIRVLVHLIRFVKFDLIESRVPWARADLFPGFGRSSLLALALVPLLGALIHALLWLLFFRYDRKGAKRAEWVAETRQALRTPFYFLYWTFILGLTALTLLSDVDRHVPWVRAVAIAINFAAFVSVVWFLVKLVSVVMSEIARRVPSHTRWETLILPAAADALRGALLVVGYRACFETFHFHGGPANALEKFGSIMLIGVVAWFLVRVTLSLEAAVKARFPLDAADNLRARKIYTQFHMIQRIVIFFIALISAASVLMLFDEIRRIGATILASAGLAGIVIGFAAQQVLGNLIAGLQLAFTQPLRLDDRVVVDGQFGTVEEISLTYVVIRVWDERRLVVPINTFTTKPFENWTRTSARILGTVFLHVDYRAPVAEIRAEAERVVRASPLWDGRVFNLIVNELKERTMELRVLVSASDSGKAFDLRVAVREALAEFLRTRYPEAYPTVRFREAASDERSETPTITRRDLGEEPAPGSVPH